MRLSRHGEAPVGTHGFGGVEQDVYERLLQLAIIAPHSIAGRGKRPSQVNAFVLELPIHQTQAMIQDIMQMNL